MIDPIVGLVIEKGAQLGTFRHLVKPGRYTVDTLIRLRGEVTVGPDTEKRVSASIPWQQMCAVLLSKLNGVTVESVLAEALAAQKGDGSLLENINERARTAVDKLVESTRQTVNGSVKARVEIEEIEI